MFHGTAWKLCLLGCFFRLIQHIFMEYIFKTMMDCICGGFSLYAWALQIKECKQAQTRTLLTLFFFFCLQIFPESVSNWACLSEVIAVIPLDLHPSHPGCRCHSNAFTDIWSGEKVRRVERRREERRGNGREGEEGRGEEQAGGVSRFSSVFSDKPLCSIRLACLCSQWKPSSWTFPNRNMSLHSH